VGKGSCTLKAHESSRYSATVEGCMILAAVPLIARKVIIFSPVRGAIPRNHTLSAAPSRLQ